MKRKLLLALLVAANNVYATDVAKSWETAPVYVPGNSFSKSTKDLDTLAQTYPVVIYLHGCTGITNNNDHGWAKTIAENGYVVVMPDSMSRSGRIPNCDPKIKGPVAAFPQAHDYRQEEIGYALEQVSRAKWASKNNVFLMGHSEGGTAVARSTYNVKAFVISGWSCTHRTNPKFDGINSSQQIPGLAIAWTRDPWREGKPNEGYCSDKAQGRKFTQVNLPGAGHDTFGNANSDIIKFLKDNTQ